MSVDLSIIIVNYKTPALICDCIRSIKDQTNYVIFEIIVVDNLSNDNSKEVICSTHSDVLWIDMNYNAGFARANNAGIRASQGETVLLLNPDTIVINHAIERSFHQFKASSYVACGVQLLFADGTPQISGNFFMKGGLNHLLPLPYWGALLKILAGALKVKKPNVPDASAEEIVDWISGAFLMVKKQAISKVGFMDEDFFLYAEEVEWCSRLQKAGTLCIFGNIRMIHLMGEVIQKATGTADKGYTNLYDKKGLQLIVSNHIRIRKQYGVGWFLFQLANFTFAVPVFFVGSILKNLFHLRNPLRDWKRIKGLGINVLKLWKISGVIISGKPHFYKVL